ncbi:MAG: TrbI/VirB10 family protein [Verrucomicrobiales bacterium]
MTPRSFLNFLRSPSGALLIFVFLLGIVLTLIITFQPHKVEAYTTPLKAKNTKPQTVKTVDRKVSKFTPPKVAPSPTQKPPIPAPSAHLNKNEKKRTIHLPPLSLFSEMPQPTEPKPPNSHFAPFGRLIRCKLVITVDSSSIDTPIIGLITHDVWHGGELIIPAGSEIHGTAQTNRVRERIASSGQWTIVWKDGRELRISGLALDREKNADGAGWAITDGSAGLKGKVLKSDNSAEIKLFASTFLSGAASALTEQEQTIFGSQNTSSLNNAPLEGAQRILGRYAQQIFTNIKQDGFYVRVPAGKQFYLYVTETLDVSKAANGKHLSTTSSK